MAPPNEALLDYFDDKDVETPRNSFYSEKSHGIGQPKSFLSEDTEFNTDIYSFRLYKKSRSSASKSKSSTLELEERAFKELKSFLVPTVFLAGGFLAFIYSAFLLVSNEVLLFYTAIFVGIVFTIIAIVTIYTRLYIQNEWEDKQTGESRLG